MTVSPGLEDLDWGRFRGIPVSPLVATVGPRATSKNTVPSLRAACRSAFVALVAAVLGPRAAAQDTVALVSSAPAKRATAVRVPRGAIQLDGRLDDAAWAGAQPFSDFVQKEPNEGAQPTERTEVAIVYDDDALYVSLRAFSNDPSKIQAPLSRRDNTTQAEHIWISLDTYHDKRTAYSFGVTASGVRMDFYHPSDNEYDFDTRFDPVWEARAVIDSVGWTGELRIPFSQLRFTARDEQVWGLNVDRWVPARREDIFWIPTPKNEVGWSSRMGELVGIRGIAPSMRLELLPYVASDARLTPDTLPDSIPANPFDDHYNVAARAGLDVKMGVGPNLTLDATFNPDFGQVEADPAIVNLSAFEVFFDERRPFFTEGSELLESNLFYSRRIGARPRGSAGGDYVDYPAASTIIGAGKLTGRLPSGLSLAALAAVTGREHAASYDTASGTTTKTVVAPVTGYGAVRALQEFGRDHSTIGAMFSFARRDLDAGSPLASLLTDQALNGRVDWNLRFARGAYELSGYFGVTHVSGDSTAILGIQRSPVHYFQRPDADHVEVDSSLTSLTGYYARLEFEKNSGKHWLYSAEVFRESPGFEPNDIGRLGNADGQGTFAGLTYRETRPGPVFYRYEFFSGLFSEWNFEGDRQYSEVFGDAVFTWKNYWQTVISASNGFPDQDQYATRGGPSMGQKHQWAVAVSQSNSFGAKNRWNARVFYGRAPLGGETMRLSGGVTLTPSSRWQISVTPNYLRDITAQQYVATLDSGPAATYDGRYVFGTVDQSTFSLQLRLNYTFTPDLTLEYYGEPFAASGKYYSFGHLAQPRTTSLTRYSTDTTQTPSIGQDASGNYIIHDVNGYRRDIGNPDFNVLSFRTNMVLRWEWRRGSTLYLVWQQNRGSDDHRGEHVGFGDVWDSRRAPGENFLAIKISYWIPAN